MFCFASLYLIKYTVFSIGIQPQNHKDSCQKPLYLSVKLHFNLCANPLGHSKVYIRLLLRSTTITSIPLCAVQIWIKFTQDKMLYKCLSFSVAVAWRQASLNLVNINIPTYCAYIQFCLILLRMGVSRLLVV